MYMSSKLFFEIELHGFLFWASMGLLMPVGVLAMRIPNRKQHPARAKAIFYLHVTLQVTCVLLATTGAILSIRDFENSFNNIHQRLGLALYFLVGFQAFSGIFRSYRKKRRLWYVVHWLLGSTVSLLGVINVFTGLQAYQIKTSRSSRMWTILFIIQIAFIALIYLLQEKHDYIIKKQGTTLGNEAVQPTDQDISPRDNQDKAARNDETCR